MTTQSESQKIGAEGHSKVELICRSSRKWIARKQDEDFGIDMELEPSLIEVSGHFLKCQIKTHQIVSKTKKTISEVLEKKFLRYAYECKLPVILIVVSLDTDETWYIWLQKWLLVNNKVSKIYKSKSKSETVSVKIERQKTLVGGLNTELLSIAKWEDAVQLNIAARDLASLSSKLYNDKLARVLFEYLCDIQNPDLIDSTYFDLLISKALELEMKLWGTSEGNDVAMQLYKFIRSYGDKLNFFQIEKLIKRGDNCSRTGIICLSLIYDRFPEHALRLNLPTRFKNFIDPRLHFYCTVREKFITEKSPHWIVNNLSKLHDNNLKFDLESDEIFNKWANRGDSIFWDYVIQN